MITYKTGQWVAGILTTIFSFVIVNWLFEAGFGPNTVGGKDPATNWERFEDLTSGGNWTKGVMDNGSRYAISRKGTIVHGPAPGQKTLPGMNVEVAMNFRDGMSAHLYPDGGMTVFMPDGTMEHTTRPSLSMRTMPVLVETGDGGVVQARVPRFNHAGEIPERIWRPVSWGTAAVVAGIAILAGLARSYGA